jgi:hypothetical protein
MNNIPDTSRLFQLSGCVPSRRVIVSTAVRKRETALTHDAPALNHTGPGEEGRSALDVVDLDRFPLHQPSSAAYLSQVDEARRSLSSDGCCILKRFIRPDAMAKLAAETAALAPKAYFTGSRATVYGGPLDPTYPTDHPRNIPVQRDNGFVAADFIGQQTAIRQLYQAAPFRTFIGQCLGADEIFEYADPLAALVINVLKPGKGHGWHFDTNEFVVTLATQLPVGGGEFEYCPGLRNAESENFPAVAAVVQGERAPVRRLDLQAGDLQIFFGRYSLHRVAPVEGERERHTVIFAYARTAGMVGNPEKTRKIFGRLTDDHQRPDTSFVRADGLTDGA